MELIPHSTILLRCPFKPLDAPGVVNRIKRCQVAQLHGQAAGAPAQFGRNLLDHGVGRAETSERQFAIKIQRDEQMLTRPFNRRRFGHTARLSDAAAEKKQKPA